VEGKGSSGGRDERWNEEESQMVKESDEQRRRGIRGALAKDKRAKAKRRGGGGGSRAKEGERKGRSKAVET
jgi:hypothetical protein